MISPISAKLVSEPSAPVQADLCQHAESERSLGRDSETARVRELYDGLAGGLLNFCSVASLHQPLLGQPLRRVIGVGRCQQVLDVGTGAGQVLKHLVAFTSNETAITACDLSLGMLQRAQSAISRLASSRDRSIRFQLADVNQLPFANESFDLVTCGYVLEHVADLHRGLRELRRVLVPGGRLLLSATEDTFLGQMCGRIWSCRTLNRDVLREACAEVGLPWTQQLWFSKGHRLLRMGGILVEAQREA